MAKIKVKEILFDTEDGLPIFVLEDGTTRYPQVIVAFETVTDIAWVEMEAVNE